MTFKDALAKDVATTFFNVTEFAEMCRVDGKEMPVVIDADEINRQSEPGRVKGDDGIYVAEITLFVRVCDYGRKPANGKPITLDGRPYLITDCQEMAGVYTMRLTRRKQ